MAEALSLPDAPLTDKANQTHDQEVEPAEDASSLPAAADVKAGASLEDMFDDSDEDEFTSSGAQAPMYIKINIHKD